MESCDDCGFTWENVRREEVGPRVAAGAAATARVLATEPDRVHEQPSEGRWSMIEYGAHVRDVLLMMRDRIVVGLVEDTPGFKPMYRDERIRLGLYRSETVSSIVPELELAATLFARLFEAIDPSSLERRVTYGFPFPAERTLLWMGQQVVHEVEHHLADIEEDLRLVTQA